MPLLLVGSAVVSTQGQQVGVDAGVVGDQQHREEIIGRDEDQLEALLPNVVFQPIEGRHKVGMSIVGLTEEVSGDAAAGGFFYFAHGISGFYNYEFANVGQGLFR